MTQRFSCYDDKEFLELVEIIRDADCSCANLEGSFHDWEGYPAHPTRTATWMVGKPEILDDLIWMGFKLVCRANNHSQDFGLDGLMATSRELKKRNLPYAGVGMNLEEARLPTYLETRRGRVALISATTSFASWAMAGYPRRDMIGRPGVNGIRYSENYIVNATTIENLKELSSQLGLYSSPSKEDEFNLWLEGGLRGGTRARIGARFVEGKKPEIVQTPNKRDVEENIRSINEAKRMADWVLYGLHHSMENFIPSICKEFIDAGADAVLGHGPHRLEGLEIYKKKPIFYSLSDFFQQNDQVLRQPSDFYERFNLDSDSSVADALDARNQWDDGARRRNIIESPLSWEAILPLCMYDFKTRELIELKLYPVDCGWLRPRPQRYPMIAKGKRGEQIIKRVKDLSIKYGTRISYEDGIGIVEI
jgi:poly-gamma-glutamate synthesis protein (capsule biosynthesis protein)